MRFTPTHAQKDGKRYRYYVDPALATGVTPAMADLPRIPALEIEYAVRKGLALFLRDTKPLLTTLGSSVKGAHAERAIKQAQELAADILDATPMTWMPLIRPAIDKIVVHSDAIALSIAPAGLRAVLLPAEEVDAEQPGRPSAGQERDARPYEYRITAAIRTRGGVMKLVVGNGGSITGAAPDPILVRTIAHAHDWAERLRTGKVDSIREIAKDEEVTESYVVRVLRLGFLAPEIVEAIVEGRQPVELTADRLVLREGISPVWKEQARRLAGTA
jgi:hypothetical protein